MRFQNKTVVVTGAAGGIGAAICTRFGNEGAKIVVADVNAEGAAATVTALQGLGIEARACVSDISQRDGCITLIDTASWPPKAGLTCFATTRVSTVAARCCPSPPTIGACLLR